MQALLKLNVERFRNGIHPIFADLNLNVVMVDREAFLSVNRLQPEEKQKQRQNAE